MPKTQYRIYDEVQNIDPVSYMDVNTSIYARLRNFENFRNEKFEWGFQREFISSAILL